MVIRAFALNIISKPGTVASGTSSVGDELGRMLREDALALPGLPAAAAAVAGLSGSPPDRGQALAEIVRCDEGLRWRLMEVGRQAAADPGLRLETPQDVIGWIGPAEATDIAYTASLHDALFKDCARQSLARHLWQVCIAAAIWSREAAALARRRSRLSYACGLLHDIGKPVTALACDGIAARLGVAPDPALTARLVHEHHAAVTELVAHRWNLPEPIVSCMRGLRNGCAAGQGPLELPVVHLGHHLAELVASQGPEFAREALAADPVLDLLNIGPDRFRGLVDRASWVACQAEAY